MKAMKWLVAAAFAAAVAFGDVNPALAGTGNLTVIHGISGLPQPVDVYANGNKLFSFDFNEVPGPTTSK
jgi:hypothetical protein